MDSKYPAATSTDSRVDPSAGSWRDSVQEPQVEVRLRMERRLLHQVRQNPQSEAGATTTVLLEEGSWRAIYPRIRGKELSRPGIARAYMLDMKEGAVLPAHCVFGREEILVVDGVLSGANVSAGRGSFHVMPAGTRQCSLRATMDSVVYLRGTWIDSLPSMIKSIVRAWLPVNRREPVMAIKPEDLRWANARNSAATKQLWSESDAGAMLIRLAAGASWALPQGLMDQESIVLEGEAFFGDRVLLAGDYRMVRAGHATPPVRSDAGALLFTRYALPLPQ